MLAKVTSRKLFLAPITNIYFGPDDGSGGGSGQGAGGAAGGQGQGGQGDGAGQGTGTGDKGVGAGANPPPKTFTQEQVDKMIDARFKKERTEKEAVISDLKKLQDSAKLTEQEKSELASRIEGLETSLQSKEQQAAAQAKLLENKHAKALEGITSERDTWKGRYSTAMIERNIQDAAIAQDGLEPSQFVLMFGSSTRIEEEKDSEGKTTGRFVTMTKFQGVDPETKKPVAMDLPTSEAISFMRENGLHKNLFDHKAKPGTGTSQSGGGTKGKSPSQMPVREDFANQEAFSLAYHTWRNDYDVDGTPRKKS